MAEETIPQQTSLSNPALARLSAFVGAWQWEASVGGQPIGRGPTVFAWQEGGAFLVEHAGAEQPEFPSSTAIFGCDDTTETYCMVQVDSRGISRIYQMSLRDGVWKLWRDAPGFSQRFEGMFSDDGKTISGRWEKSADGLHLRGETASAISTVVLFVLVTLVASLRWKVAPIATRNRA